MAEDWCDIVYAFVLLVIANKEDKLNSFITEHIGEWLNGILDAVENNAAVNLTLLVIIISAECFLVRRLLKMKGKVNWPKAEIHTSVFAKLKRAVNKSGLKAIQKEIMKKYSQVNAKRNALFHGGDVEIDVEDVEKAFGAFEWLREKMQP